MKTKGLLVGRFRGTPECSEALGELLLDAGALMVLNGDSTVACAWGVLGNAHYGTELLDVWTRILDQRLLVEGAIDGRPHAGGESVGPIVRGWIARALGRTHALLGLAPAGGPSLLMTPEALAVLGHAVAVEPFEEARLPGGEESVKISRLKAIGVPPPISAVDRSNTPVQAPGFMHKTVEIREPSGLQVEIVRPTGEATQGAFAQRLKLGRG